MLRSGRCGSVAALRLERRNDRVSGVHERVCSRRRSRLALDLGFASCCLRLRQALLHRHLVPHLHLLGRCAVRRNEGGERHFVRRHESCESLM